MENELPISWCECILRDVASIQNGYAFSTKDFRKDKGVPLIKQTQLDGDKVDLTKCVFLDEEFLQSKREFVLKKGDILLGMSGSLGKICKYDLDAPAMQNQRTGKVIPVSGHLLDNKLLWYFLMTIERALLDKGKGMGVANVSANDIENLPFYLPPSNEQKRIVAKLDALMEKVDANKERIERIPAILKRFRKSVLNAAINGQLSKEWRLANKNSKPCPFGYDPNDYEWKDVEFPEKWKWAYIKDTGDHILGKMLDASKNKGTPTPYLRNINVRWFGFDLGSVSEMKATPDDKIKFNIMEGDVFVCEGGEPGRSAVWRSGNTNLIFQKAIHRIRPNEHINPDWIVYNLKIDADNGNIERLFTGTGIKHLTGKSLSKYPIPIPPIKEQEMIICRVKELFAVADKLEARYTKAKAMLDKLPQSILAKAFRGELVPQDPNDEPARVLLERIRKSKASNKAKKKGQ